MGLGAILAAYSVRVSRAGRIVSSRLDTVRGTVLEGPLPQPGLEVVLRDEMAAPGKDEKDRERKVNSATK